MSLPTDENPYQSPDQSSTAQLSPPGNEAARAIVRLPAMILMIMSIVAIFFAILAIGLNIFGVGMTAFMPEGQADQQETVALWMQGITGIIWQIFCIALYSFMIYGCKKMMALESRAVVLTTLILAVIPCCSPCCIFSMPIGIWGLVVMFDPVVKTSFES